MSTSSAAAAAMGRRSGEARRQRREAIERLVEASRKAQGLPRSVTDLEILERVAALLEGSDDAG